MHASNIKQKFFIKKEKKCKKRLHYIIHLFYICSIKMKQTLKQNDMNTLTKLIEIIKSNSRKEVGNVQTNSKGVKYQYVIYHLNTPFNWVVKMFEKAQIEVYGGTTKARGGTLGYDYTRLSHKNISMHCDYPQFKGQKPRSISISELIIIQ